jgi:hypothetical protein
MASSAKAVPSLEMQVCKWLSGFSGREPGGRKVLLTMFARQFFPS